MGLFAKTPSWNSRHNRQSASLSSSSLAQAPALAVHSTRCPTDSGAPVLLPLNLKCYRGIFLGRAASPPPSSFLAHSAVGEICLFLSNTPPPLLDLLGKEKIRRHHRHRRHREGVATDPPHRGSRLLRQELLPGLTPTTPPLGRAGAPPRVRLRCVPAELCHPVSPGKAWSCAAEGIPSRCADTVFPT
jgi:hypothetical protein